MFQVHKEKKVNGVESKSLSLSLRDCTVFLQNMILGLDTKVGVEVVVGEMKEIKFLCKREVWDYVKGLRD